MGWDFITPLATVQLGAAVGVDGEALVGVDSDAEKTRVSIDKLVIVSLLEIMQYGSVVEVCQIGHILSFLVFGRVDLGHLVLLEVLLLFEKKNEI
jgi:hypothetical protein